MFCSRPITTAPWFHWLLRVSGSSLRIWGLWQQAFLLTSWEQAWDHLPLCTCNQFINQCSIVFTLAADSMSVCNCTCSVVTCTYFELFHNSGCSIFTRSRYSKDLRITDVLVMPLKLWQLNAPHGLHACAMCTSWRWVKMQVSIGTANVSFPETLKFYFHAYFARKHGSTSPETEERDVCKGCPQFPDEKLCGQHLCS